MTLAARESHPGTRRETRGGVRDAVLAARRSPPRNYPPRLFPTARRTRAHSSDGFASHAPALDGDEEASAGDPPSAEEHSDQHALAYVRPRTHTGSHASSWHVARHAKSSSSRVGGEDRGGRGTSPPSESGTSSGSSSDGEGANAGADAAGAEADETTFLPSTPAHATRRARARAVWDVEGMWTRAEGMRRSGRAGVRGDGDASVPRTISDRRGLFFVVRKVSVRPSSSSVSLSERRTLWIQSAHLFRVIRCFLPCRADAVPRGSWEVAMRSARRVGFNRTPRFGRRASFRRSPRRATLTCPPMRRVRPPDSSPRSPRARLTAR